MTNFDTLTIPTQNHGDVKVWKEDTLASMSSTLDVYEVWGAQGTDVHGRVHRGYGGTAQAAVVSLLGNTEKGRLDPPAPTEALAADPLKFRPLSDFAVQGTVTGRFTSEKPGFIEGSLDYIRPAIGDHVDLPPRFWYLATHGQKIQAIKILREITSLSLKSAKDVVDKIAESAPRPQHTYEFTAKDQPEGTVIRINGDLDPSVDPTRYGGYVFEKLDDDGVWNTAGNEDDFSDQTIQDLTREHGYEILYLPKAAR